MLTASSAVCATCTSAHLCSSHAASAADSTVPLAHSTCPLPLPLPLLSRRRPLLSLLLPLLPLASVSGMQLIASRTTLEHAGYSASRKTSVMTTRTSMMSIIISRLWIMLDWMNDTSRNCHESWPHFSSTSSFSSAADTNKWRLRRRRAVAFSFLVASCDRRSRASFRAASWVLTMSRSWLAARMASSCELPLPTVMRRIGAVFDRGSKVVFFWLLLVLSEPADFVSSATSWRKSGEDSATPSADLRRAGAATAAPSSEFDRGDVAELSSCVSGVWSVCSDMRIRERFARRPTRGVPAGPVLGPRFRGEGQNRPMLGSKLTFKLTSRKCFATLSLNTIPALL